MNYKIKVVNKISPKGLNLLGNTFEINEDTSNPDAILVRSAKVDTNEYSDLLAVGRAGAGVNNITVEQATENGICIFNTPGANANAVAELVFTMLGYGARNIGKSIEYVQNLQTENEDAVISQKVEANKSNFKGFELTGKKLAVIGLGKIGVLTSNYGIYNDMEVFSYDPYPTVSNVHHLDSRVQIVNTLQDALSSADVVSVHVPLNDHTKNLIGEQEINLTNTGSILMNFARDGIYNDDAIEKSLNSERISKYISDFPKKRFLTLDNAINLPHLGASTSESEENCAIMISQQVKDYLQYGNITNSVNFSNIVVPLQNSVKNRLIVINKDIPNMIAHITKIIGEAKLNIQSLSNESNGKIGYNIIDIDTIFPQSVFNNIKALDHIIKIRLLSF